ncbi:MAG: O-antigen ligase family protein, partial [Proteobacteria bacterium]|nr:O-antigen ligase family protein [Pseudomonadota bacterium]
IWFILFVVTAQAAVGIIASRLELHLVPIEQLDGHWFFARGTFVNRNHYAAMLGIGVSLCIASFIARSLTNAHRGESTLEERQSPAILRNTYFMLTEGTVLCGCLGVLLIGILLSESRGGLIAPVLTLVLLWCYLFRGARATQLVSWISALIIAVFLVAFALGETDSLVNRFASIYEDGGWLFVWRAVAPIAIDNWFWGVGVGAFIANFELYRTAEFMQWQLPHAHSQYLHLMIEQGIPGLLLWMLPIILVLRKALSKVTTAKSMYVRKMCLMCATVIITLSVHSIWEVHLQQPAISVYFYVFLALGIVSTEIYTKSDSARV